MRRCFVAVFILGVASFVACSGGGAGNPTPRPSPTATSAATPTATPTSSVVTGVVTEYPLPSASSLPYEIAAGTDGNLWFTQYNGPVGKISTAGTIALYPSAGVTSGQEGLAPGPGDGNMWVITNGALLAKFTPSGSVAATIPLPSGSNAQFDVAGPDGNVWVSDANGWVYKVTPTGTLTSYRITIPGQPAYGGSVEGIAVGSDHNIWFADTGNGAIGVMVPATGSYNEYPLPHGGPTGTSSPYSLAAGPDGNIWYTDQAGDTIGKVTTSGTFTVYPLTPPHGIANSDPISITAADGNLWFTERSADRVARITPGGVITEFTIPTPDALLWGIAPGPDGNIWFTEFSASQIGKLVP